MHAHHDPVDIMILMGSSQFPFEPSFLSALGISTDVGIATVLVYDIVVGDADDVNRARREGIPEPSRNIRLTICRRQGKVGLIGSVADRPVAQLVLMVSCARHPG